MGSPPQKALVCYLPDHEPSLGVRLADLEPDCIPGFSLARQVDLLLHDAQYDARDGMRVTLGNDTAQ